MLLLININESKKKEGDKMFINLSRRIMPFAINISLFFIIFIVLYGCSKKAQIVGEVLDNFGTPLKGANISIDGTTFKATTDEKGKYSIGYVPGKIKVLIGKEGYTSAELTLDIASESTYPAKSVTLYKIPVKPWIYLIGDSDYIPLNRGSFSHLGPSKFKIIGQFTQIQKGSKLRFIDNDEVNEMIVKLTDEAVLIIEFYLKFAEVEERTEKVGDGIFIREISVDKGKYAFITFNRKLDPYPIMLPIYLFEVK